MTTWDEIKNLSKLLKDTQEKKNSFTLPERTWVDIISQVCKIYDLKLFNTLDGRYYLTTEELLKEIYEEVECNNGRISISELSSNINFSEETIERIYSSVNEFYDVKLICVHNEIISSVYLNGIKKEIIDKVDEKGSIEISTLSKMFNLPETLILELVSQMDRNSIKQFNDTLFSNGEISILKAKTTGTLAAVLYPVQIAQLCKCISMPEYLLVAQIETLIQSKVIKGFLSANKSTYIPEIYYNERLNYAKNFFNLNKFIEFTLLKKLGISEAETFVKNNLGDAQIHSGYAINKGFVEELVNTLREIILEEKWVDVSLYVPSELHHLHLTRLFVDHLKDERLRTVDESNFIFSKTLFDDILPCLQGYINETAVKAAKEIMEKAAQAEKEGESNSNKSKKTSQAASKSAKKNTGGGREIKTKATKKKYHTSNEDRDEPESQDVNSFDINLTEILDRDEMAELACTKDSNLPLELILDVLEENWSDLCETHLAQEIHKERKRLENEKSAVLGGGLEKESIARAANELDNMFYLLEAFELGTMHFVNEKNLYNNLTRSTIKQNGSHLVNYTCLLLSKLYCVEITNLFDEDVLKSDQDDEENGYCKIQKPEISYETINNDMRKKFIQSLSKINVPEMNKLIENLNQLHTWITMSSPERNLLSVMPHFDYILGDILSIPFQFHPSELASLTNKKRNTLATHAMEYTIKLEYKLAESCANFKEEYLNLKKISPQVTSECPIGQYEKNFQRITDLSGTISLLSTSIVIQAICSKFPILLSGKLVPDIIDFLKDFEIAPDTKDKSLLIVKETRLLESLKNLTSIIINLIRAKQNGLLSFESLDEIMNITNNLSASVPLLRKSLSQSKK